MTKRILACLLGHRRTFTYHLYMSEHRERWRSPRRGDPEKTLYVNATSRKVFLYNRDRVGNNLDKVLAWCSTHFEPVWVYGDESFQCPHDLLIEQTTTDHVLTSGPWQIKKEG